MTEFAVPPYDYETKRGTIRHIYVRTGEKSGECQLTLISATRKLPELDTLIERLRAAEPSLTGILINHNQRGDNVILGDRTDVLWGEPMLEDRLCGNTFLLSPHAFYQVNHAQAERLYACAVDYAGLTGGETVLDLYCGAGTITLALAAHAKHAVGVEIVPEAIENAKNNARRNGAENVEFYCADAGQAAGRFSGIDVLVEASGLADPTNVRRVLAQFPAVSYQGSVCVADAARLEKVFSTARACPRQLAVSSLVLLNKTDLATEAQCAEAKALILRANPAARIRRTQFGRFEPEWLPLIVPDVDVDEVLDMPDITLQKAVLQIRPTMPFTALQKCLVQLAGETWRIKGFVRVPEGIFYVDCTGPEVRLTPWQGEADNRLVLLAGKGMQLRRTARTAVQWYNDYIEELSMR